MQSEETTVVDLLTAIQDWALEVRWAWLHQTHRMSPDDYQRGLLLMEQLPDQIMRHAFAAAANSRNSCPQEFWVQMREPVQREGFRMLELAAIDVPARWETLAQFLNLLDQEELSKEVSDAVIDWQAPD